MKTSTNTVRVFAAAITRLVHTTRRVARLLPMVLASHVAGYSGALLAQSAMVPRIVGIVPSQALVGQTITVNTAMLQVSMPILTGYRAAVYTSFIPSYNPQAPRIYFADASGQPTIQGTGVLWLGENSYRVTVPQNARSGPLRIENGFNSLVNLTISVAGYSIANLSQFDVVSVKVDGIERLAPGRIRAVSQSSPTVNVADIGAPAGSHTIQVTLGPSLGQPVIVYEATANATSPTNVIEVTVMAAGEYLTSSPNRTVSGNVVTCSWQAFVVIDVSVRGFDFSFNTATGTTTWVHWSGSRSNVLASGTVVEPTSWLLNPTSATLTLRRNGSVYTNVIVNLLSGSFVAGDGFAYDLQ